MSRRSTERRPPGAVSSTGRSAWPAAASRRATSVRTLSERPEAMLKTAGPSICSAAATARAASSTGRKSRSGAPSRMRTGPGRSSCQHLAQHRGPVQPGPDQIGHPKHHPAGRQHPILVPVLHRAIAPGGRRPFIRPVGVIRAVAIDRGRGDVDEAPGPRRQQGFEGPVGRGLARGPLRLEGGDVGRLGEMDEMRARGRLERGVVGNLQPFGPYRPARDRHRSHRRIRRQPCADGPTEEPRGAGYEDAGWVHPAMSSGATWTSASMSRAAVLPSTSS